MQFVAGNEDASPNWENCKLFDLHLPSSLDSDTRTKVCSKHLVDAENQLRFAHLAASLDTLRSQLRTRAFGNRFKIKNITGQRKNTRARAWQRTIDKKILATKWNYRTARSAVLCLRGNGDWETTYRVLNDDDVVAYNERAMTLEEKLEREAARRASGLVEEEILAQPLGNGLQLGEGRRHLSWIWLTQGGFDPQVNAQAEHTGMWLYFIF